MNLLDFLKTGKTYPIGYTKIRKQKISKTICNVVSKNWDFSLYYTNWYNLIKIIEKRTN